MSTETWKFINTFAPWFSAFGTFSAVVVSLYLARKSNIPKIRVLVGHRIMITSGVPGPHPEYIMFKITNTGNRVVNINNIGWRIGWKFGWIKRQYAIQPLGDNPESSKIPITLSDGQEATYFIRLRPENNWITNFVREFIKTKHTIMLLSLRVQVFTSIGKTFSQKVEVGLRQQLTEEMRRQFSN